MNNRVDMMSLWSIVVAIFLFPGMASGNTEIKLGLRPNLSIRQMLSIRLLNVSKADHTASWAIAINGDACNERNFAFVEFPPSSALLLDRKKTNMILQRTIDYARVNCPNSSSYTAVVVKRNVSLMNAAYVGWVLAKYDYGLSQEDEVLAELTEMGSNVKPLISFNKVALQHDRTLYAIREKKRLATEEQIRDSKAQAFADRFGASGGWVNWQRLETNPFSYEGKTLVFNARFQRMITPTAGIFDNNIVFSDLPKNTFISPGLFLVAGKVLGTTTIKNQFGADISVPNVEYLGHISCRDSECGGYFKANLRGR